MKVRSPFAPRASRMLIADLAAMIALAVGVGLATAIVLGGTVLLLSDDGGNNVPVIVAPVSGVPLQTGDAT